MKKQPILLLASLLALSILIVGIVSNATANRDIDNSMKCVLYAINEYSSSAGFVGYQGIAVNEEYVFLTDSTNQEHQDGHCTIRKYTKDGDLVDSRTDYNNDSAYLKNDWQLNGLGLYWKLKLE